MLHRTVNMPANIEMVGDLKSLSKKVAEQSLVTLSQFKLNNQDDEFGYYNSRHLISVHKIISIYKRHKLARNLSAADKYFFRKAPPLLHKLGVYLLEQSVGQTKIEPLKDADGK